MKKWNWLPLLLLTAFLITGCAKSPGQEVPAGEEQTVGNHQQQPAVTDPQETVQDIEPEVTFGDDNWQPDIQPSAPDGETEDPWQGGIVLPEDEWDD